MSPYVWRTVGLRGTPEGSAYCNKFHPVPNRLGLKIDTRVLMSRASDAPVVRITLNSLLTASLEGE